MSTTIESQPVQQPSGSNASSPVSDQDVWPPAETSPAPSEKHPAVDPFFDPFDDCSYVDCSKEKPTMFVKEEFKTKSADTEAAMDSRRQNLSIFAEVETVTAGSLAPNESAETEEQNGDSEELLNDEENVQLPPLSDDIWRHRLGSLEDCFWMMGLLLRPQIVGPFAVGYAAGYVLNEEITSQLDQPLGGWIYDKVHE